MPMRTNEALAAAKHYQQALGGWPHLKSERYTHAQRCLCLLVLDLHFLCHIILLREVRDRLPIVPRV